MKKIVSLFPFLLVAILTVGQANAQKGETQLNAGVGLSSRGIPVYVGLDYWVHPDITIGAELSFRSYDDDYGNVDYHHSITGIIGNANYHFNRVLDIPQQWDFYAGLNLGFYIWGSPSDYIGSNSSGLGLGAQLGGRYFFSDKFGINLEFTGGNTVSGSKLGITLKF